MNHVVSTLTAVSQLSLAEVGKSYGDQLVLDRVSLSVPAGEKVGVVGENGSGKSTVLRLLAGEESPDNGDVIVMAAGGIGHAAQTLALSDDHTVADIVDLAFSDLRRLERRIAAAEATLADADPNTLAEYGDLLTEYEQRGGYQAEARVATAMHALGLAEITLEQVLHVVEVAVEEAADACRVQVVLLRQVGPLGRRHRSFAGERLDGVALAGEHQRVDDQGGPEERQDHLEEAPKDVAEHA